MTNVKMVALDTVHITSVSKDNLTAGTEFEIDSTTAKDLETRGIAKRAEEASASTDVGTKAEAPLANKMEATPSNKAEVEAAQTIADAPISAGALASTSRRTKA